MTKHKNTQISFLLNEDRRVPLTVSQTNSKQNQVSILKKTANHNPAVAKPAAKSRVLKSSGTVSEESSSSCAAGSKVLQKVCLSIRTSSTTADGSGCSKVKSSAVKALPKTKMTCLASARIPEQPVKPTSTASSAKTGPDEKLVGVNTKVRPHQRNVPLSTQLSTISENEKLLKEPSNLPVSGATQSRSLPKIGLSQLIIVSCQEKQQVYCQLCSVRLRTSTHSTSFTHCCNYVKMKYPGWTANLSEIGDKFKDIVAHLAEIEKSIGSQKPQRTEVKKAFYLKLAALSEKEAIEELKTIERQDPRNSSSVSEPVQTYRQEAQSPCEVSSSNDGEDCKAGTLTRDHLQTSASCIKMDQNHVPSSETKDAAETAKQNPFMPAIDAQPQSLISSSRVRVDSIFPPERKLSKSLSPAQDAPKAGNCRPKVEMCSPKKRAESVQIKRTGLGHKVREAPMHDGPPRGHDELPPPPPITCFGRKASGCSNLVLFLHARQVDTKQVIGMEFLWECRGICLDTFYLCESCEETVSNRDVCQHVTSRDHQLEYMWKKHPEFLKIFWQEEDLPQALKINILQEVIWRLAERDSFQKIDAKCIILQQKLHQFVRMTHFSEALKIVQSILNEEKATIHLPLSAACQWNEEITKSTVLEELSNVGTSDVITKTDFSPVDMSCSSSNTDLVSSGVPNRSIEDAKPNPFQKPVLSALALPQSSDQKLVPEETSCTAFGTELNVSVSGPTKKRPASSSTDPLPAKRMLIMQKIKCEPASPNSTSPPVNLPAGPSLLGIIDEDSGPKHLQSTVDQDLFSKLTSHLKRIISKLTKDNIKTINSCPTSFPAIPQTRWDAKIDNSGSVSYDWDSVLPDSSSSEEESPHQLVRRD